MEQSREEETTGEREEDTEWQSRKQRHEKERPVPQPWMYSHRPIREMREAEYESSDTDRENDTGQQSRQVMLDNPAEKNLLRHRECDRVYYHRNKLRETRPLPSDRAPMQDLIQEIQERKGSEKNEHRPHRLIDIRTIPQCCRRVHEK